MFTVPVDLAPAIEREFRRGWQMKRVKAEIEAKQTAQLNQLDHKSLDGIGALRMRVPGDAFHFWGQKLGYDCWNDANFLREYERDNPQVKVNSGGTKMQVGFGQHSQGASYVPGKSKFHKSYG